jgi:hypothetical protein
VIATYVTLATVILGFLAAVIGYVRVTRKQDEIHVIVNSRYTDVSNRVEQLIKVLEEHGIRIPTDPNPPRGTLP